MTRKKIMEKLEDRILFDAVPDGNFFTGEEVEQPIIVQQHDMQDEACDDCPKQIIFVDPGVEDGHLLIESILENSDGPAEVVFLSPMSDGVAQISEQLSSRPAQYSAIHIISHGSDGEVSLGDETLNHETLSGHSDSLASWSESLTDDADLLFYGCNVAETDHGMSLMQRIAMITETDVAASSDLTGAAELGGDWDLEFTYGSIDVTVLDGEGWDGSLNSPPAFSGEAGLFQVYSKKGQLAEMDLTNKTLENAPNSMGEKMNAVGFRAADNYAYGVMRGNQIGRLGADGTAEVLGTITGLPADHGGIYVGDFGGDDLLYVRPAKANGALYGINVDTLAVENTITLSGNLNSVYDIAYNSQDDHFYASQRGVENQLLKISAADGTLTNVGGNGISKHTFGAMFADVTGSVYGASNKTGEVYKFDLTTGAATLVGMSGISGTNDGFSNAYAEIDLPPMAADDTFSTLASQQINSNIFSNNGYGSDVDANGDTITLTKVNGDAGKIGNQFALDSGALVTVNLDGSFNYDSNGAWDDLVKGQVEIESFTYTISDGTTENQATVKIFVGGEFGNGNASVDIVEDTTTDITSLDGLDEEAKTLVVSAGDFNGDGFEDVIVGDSSVNEGAGEAYVVFGDANGLPTNVDVDSLASANGGDGSAGLLLTGLSEDDRFGAAVASIGDVNGDGLDDILVSATDRDDNGDNSGASYVIYGSNSHGAEFDVSTLYSANGGDGSDGAVYKGFTTNDTSGQVIAKVGDVNNDGLDDFAIVSQDADVDGHVNAGQTYVIFGSANANAENQLNALNGSNGFTISGSNDYDHLGAQISGGVDVNGDGIDDMVVTSRTADSYEMVDNGQSYLIYGSNSFDANINTSDLIVDNGGDGSKGTVFHGTDKATGNGSYVSLVEDTNGDGIGEIVMGVGSDTNVNFTINGATDNFGAEFQIISMKESSVYADNFDD
ncbi:MAG: DUF4347 domain-containing protein [Planctomycetota bacterium]